LRIVGRKTNAAVFGVMIGEIVSDFAISLKSIARILAL
jgi:hypothetical protein